MEYLAKKHTETYIEIGHEQGLGLKGIMNEVEAAAMWRDARLLDYQAITILKHLRYFFDSKITVPFQKNYSLVEGYTVPKVKVFEYHVQGEKYPEIVHAQYQDIAREFARAVEELIREKNLKPEDIMRMFLVWGGDHGQGAFRVVFRALLLLRGVLKPCL